MTPSAPPAAASEANAPMTFEQYISAHFGAGAARSPAYNGAGYQINGTGAKPSKGMVNTGVFNPMRYMAAASANPGDVVDAGIEPPTLINDGLPYQPYNPGGAFDARGGIVSIDDLARPPSGLRPSTNPTVGNGGSEGQYGQSGGIEINPGSTGTYLWGGFRGDTAYQYNPVTGEYMPIERAQPVIPDESSFDGVTVSAPAYGSGGDGGGSGSGGGYSGGGPNAGWGTVAGLGGLGGSSSYSGGFGGGWIAHFPVKKH